MKKNPYISIYGQHSYRKQKTKVLLTCIEGNTPFANEDTSNVIITYKSFR